MTEPNRIMLFLLAGAGVCIALNILIGLAVRKLAQRFVPAADEKGPAAHSVKKLIFDWASYALRTLVWALYLGLVVNLLLHISQDVKDFWKTLAEIQAAMIQWLSVQGIKALIAIVITIFLLRFASALVKTIFNLIERRTDGPDEVAARRRLQTLSA